MVDTCPAHTRPWALPSVPHIPNKQSPYSKPNNMIQNSRSLLCPFSYPRHPVPYSVVFILCPAFSRETIKKTGPATSSPASPIGRMPLLLETISNKNGLLMMVFHGHDMGTMGYSYSATTWEAEANCANLLAQLPKWG